VVNGIADGCKLAGCALVGGETAEMPGMYAPGDYDLAGFAVGAVEKQNLLPRLNDVECGDVLIALPSSGPHSNGFSLIRKIMETSGASYEDVAPFESSRTFGDILLTPTRIYCKSVLAVLQSSLGPRIKALAHITGGGLIENIPRVLRPELGVNLDANQWEIPPIFLWLAQQGGLSQREFCRTFNVGIGLLLIVDTNVVDDIVKILHANGEPKVSVVGSVVAHQASVNKDQVIIQNLPNISLPGLFPAIPSKERVRVGVLISGSGTNLQALLEHCQKPKSVCEIAVVISNVAGVQGLERAQKFGVATQVIPHRNLSREEFERQVDEMLRQYRCQLVCLAGFMRLLSPFFVQRWRGSLINIHPSLLPSFKGAHAHRLVLESGVRITGATVHYVTEEMDAGAIISQGSCTVLPSDTESVLAERVKTQVEHQIFPEAMDLVARGDCTLGADGKISWKIS
jgi:phosphoribosylamine--glycine ligase/phosphoribosylglycinamide formyltransferase/phosphoribosylformylglycinamidine cyclo-ligase